MKLFSKQLESSQFIDRDVEDYAGQGLRTLVFAYKEIDEEMVAKFKENHLKR